MLETLISTLAPHTCMICNTGTELLCEACRSTEIQTIQPTCYRCNKISDNFKTCSKCRASSPIFALKKRSLYQDPLKQLIHTTKFGSSRAGTDVLAKIMIDILVESPCVFDAVCYVPTDYSRVRQRGFDHAERIAKHIAPHYSVPLGHYLKRAQSTRQLGSNRYKRQRQMRHAFYAPQSLKHIHTALLVDDVVSTGATVESAAQCLKQAGVRRVIVVVAAHNI